MGSSRTGDKIKKKVPVYMNGWLSPSGLQWFHRKSPDRIAKNYPGCSPPQDSISVSSMEVKM